MPVWSIEFATHASYPAEVKVMEGPIAKRAEELLAWPEPEGKVQVSVWNYEAFWRAEDAIKKWRPDMLILDEVQRCKTPSAQQSKAAARLGKLCRYRLGLTGTPVTQSPLDLFGEYRAIAPSIFGSSFYVFRARYAILGGFSGKEVVAYQNLPELIRKAHSIAFRVTKQEALDLPEQIDQTLYCFLEPKAQAIYRQLQKESVALLSQEKLVTAANVLARLLRLSQVAGGFLGDGEGGVEQVSKAKLALLEETLDDILDAGKKVVIFCRFLAEIAAIRKLLEKQRVGYAWIAGEVKMEARGEEVRRFQEDPDCRVFVAQIQTAGLGITLTAADTAIFYSLDYSYANYDQCKARIHRISQKNACTYLHLIARGTVDEKVMETLKNKKNVADYVVDGWKDYFSV
jgi:SNF2 family DNA or RNA helicase